MRHTGSSGLIPRPLLFSTSISILNPERALEQVRSLFRLNNRNHKDHKCPRTETMYCAPCIPQLPVQPSPNAYLLR